MMAAIRSKRCLMTEIWRKSGASSGCEAISELRAWKEF